MTYDIECKNDLLTGTTLIVKIPEDEIDRKALYTIQTDMPPFIIPFNHYCSDGEALFVYNIGMHCKLQYMTGNRAAKDYAQLWISVLSPILECADWFMHPNGFLLDSEYLYYDKNKKSCCFVYIPSIRNISQHTQLKELVADISKFISVDDAILENKILRAIMKNFDPNELLQTLRLAIVQSESTEEKAQINANLIAGNSSNVGAENICQPQTYVDFEIPDVVESDVFDNLNSKVSESVATYASDEIVIELPEKQLGTKKGRQNLSEEGGIKKTVRALSSLFEKRKEPEKAKRMFRDRNVRGADFWSGEDLQDMLAKDQPGKLTNVQNNISQSAEENLELYLETGDQMSNNRGVGLRSVGRSEAPLFIGVDIEEGDIFSIGKFDASVGRKQSSFEFDKKVKGISCRHCAIKRVAEDYLLVDLASSAGTFVNNERMPPNTAYKLTNGCRLSIGNSGADYVWEMQ